ncbi:MAG: aldo/keto reductase [Candidatus Zipacnadales bacterium]
MQYVKFGNAGIQVSRLCLGAMEFPDALDYKEATALLDEAIDHGINFIDTADAYGRGTSEEFLGQALTPAKRDKLILATKFWVMMDPQDPNSGGCSRYHILQAVEASLRRLRTDRIDLYQLHHPDPGTPIEETLSALDTLVQQGKVRYIGACNHYAWQVAHALGVSALHNWEPFVSLQVRYNILDRAIERETVHFCQRFNIAIMGYGPLCGGILTGKYQRGEPPPEGSRVARIRQMQEMLTPQVFDILDELRLIASKYDLALNQLAVAWTMAKKFITTPILGGKRADHFRPMYGLCEIALDPQDIARIDELSEDFVWKPFVNQPKVEGPSLALNRW